MRLSLALPFLLIALDAGAQRTSVLFIGNSYTYVNDLPNAFRSLALSLGDTVDVAMSAPGGYTFQQHLEYEPTLTAIDSQAWDYVVLQEQSQLPSFNNVETTLYMAGQLAYYIRLNADCTMPVFYMTWGRENGDADNCSVWPPVCTFDGMNGLLRGRYIRMAEDNDAFVAPVGAAWKQVRDTQPAIMLYLGDGSHPSPAGTYLAACNFYSTLFGSTTVGAPFIGGLTAGTAALLQGIASSTVLDSATTWNLDIAHGPDAAFSVFAETATSVTMAHAGTGSHAWTCSNGEAATDAQPTFTFAAAGTYTITHIYTDACGSSDTASIAYPFLVQGIPDLATGGVHVSSDAPSSVRVQGLTGILVLMDVQGRVLRTERLTGTDARFPCPPGLRAWTVRTPDGAVRCGKVVVQ